MFWSLLPAPTKGSEPYRLLPSFECRRMDLHEMPKTETGIKKGLKEEDAAPSNKESGGQLAA